jgi:hypothetical protein
MDAVTGSGKAGQNALKQIIALGIRECAAGYFQR